MFGGRGKGEEGRWSRKEGIREEAELKADDEQVLGRMRLEVKSR